MATITTQEEKTITHASARLRYLRIAPRKVRLVVDVIRSLPVSEAEARLLLLPKRSSGAVLKLLRSAVASATQKGMNISRLIIKEAFVDEGPMLKRWLPRAMGRATPIHKKTSHITLVLGESEKDHSVRFVIERPSRKKKSDEGKKDESKAVAEREEAEERQEASHEKEGGREQKKDLPKKGQKGFGKRIFRRKSV